MTLLCEWLGSSRILRLNATTSGIPGYDIWRCEQGLPTTLQRMAETSNCQAEEVRRALRDGAAALEATGRERPATLLRRLRGELVRLQRSSEGFFSSFVGAYAGRSEDSPPVPRRNGSLPQKRRRESEESANVAPGKRSCSDRRRVKREERWQAHLAKRGWPAEKPRGEAAATVAATTAAAAVVAAGSVAGVVNAAPPKKPSYADAVRGGPEGQGDQVAMDLDTDLDYGGTEDEEEVSATYTGRLRSVVVKPVRPPPPPPPAPSAEPQ